MYDKEPLNAVQGNSSCLHTKTTYVCTGTLKPTGTCQQAVGTGIVTPNKIDIVDKYARGEQTVGVTITSMTLDCVMSDRQHTQSEITMTCDSLDGLLTIT